MSKRPHPEDANSGRNVRQKLDASSSKLQVHNDYKSLNINDNTPLTFENVDKIIERTRQIHP